MLLILFLPAPLFVCGIVENIKPLHGFTYELLNPSSVAGFQGSGQQASLTNEESFMFPTFTPKLFFFILLPP